VGAEHLRAEPPGGPALHPSTQDREAPYEKLVADLTQCQGYAQCAFLAPYAFTMHGDEALMYDPNPGDEQRRRIMRAAAACPVQAVQLGPGRWSGRDTATHVR
jgi:ferredoxin